MKRVILVLAALILASTAFPIAYVRPQESGHFKLIKAYWGTDKVLEVSAGDVTSLTVVLRYESTYSFKNLEANLSLPNGFEAVGGGQNSSIYYTGSISPGIIVELRFAVYITQGVVKGNYTATLDVAYYVSKYLVPRDLLQIPMEVTGRPILRMNALNESLYEGRQLAMVSLSNEGDAIARDVRIAKVYSSSATAMTDGDEMLHEIEPNRSLAVPLILFVPTGMKGKIVPLTMEASCLGPRNVMYQFSETIQLPVKPSSPVPVLAVNLDPRTLSIGRSSKAYIELRNTGNHSLSEIKLTLSPDAVLKVFGPTVLYVDRLGPGESKRIETEVYVPSTTTATTGTLTIATAYVDEELWLSQSENNIVSILLRGLIEISLTDIAIIPATPVVGSPFSITITVTNIGTTTAYAAYAIPSLEDLPLRTFGPISTYIGNIEINLPTTFTINLQLLNTTQSRITLSVTLSYLDNLRTTHAATFNVQVNVGSPTGSSSQTIEQRRLLLPVSGLFIGIAAVVITAVVLILVLKRRRKAK